MMTAVKTVVQARGAELATLEEYRRLVMHLERHVKMAVMQGGLARNGKVDPLAVLKEVESMLSSHIREHGNSEHYT